MEEEVDDLPKVTSKLLGSFLKQSLDTSRFAMIAIAAIRQLSTSVPLMEAIDTFRAAEYTEEEKLEAEETLLRLKGDVAFIEADKQQRHAWVYAQAILSVWGAMEAHMDDVFVALLSHDRSLLGVDAIQKIKISIALFESASTVERLEMLVDAIQRDLNSKFKRGCMQFESVFDMIGLAGAVDPETKRLLIEFSAVRNVIAHRRSVVDRRFIDACPWLNLSTGAPLVATDAMLHHYVSHACVYAATIQERIERRYGTVTDKLVSLLAHMRRSAEAGAASRVNESVSGPLLG